MKNDSIDPHLFQLLDDLKPVGSRDSHAQARGRTRFLTEAVSLREMPRHRVWTIFPLKETLAMKIIMSTLVIVGLLFGGGATVSAAQNHLPNQSLYQVKLMSEDAKLWFVSDPVRQVDVLMEQAQTRLQEMEMLTQQGIAAPDQVQLRAQERIQRALQIAVQLDQESQRATLEQIQAHLQTQERQMLHLQDGSCTECVPMLQRTREMLQLQLRDVQSCLADPESMQIQNQAKIQQELQTQNQLRLHMTLQPTGTTVPACGSCTPVPATDGTGLQNGSGSAAAATPVQQQQQQQQQQQNQNQQQNQGGGGGGSQNGNGSGSGGPSSGSGGQGGRP